MAVRRSAADCASVAMLLLDLSTIKSMLQSANLVKSWLVQKHFSLV
jgi:hypothetical protein